MAKAPRAPTTVATVRHPGQRRVNNPTIEQQNLAPDEATVLHLPRRFTPETAPHLYEWDNGTDPQLVWADTDDGQGAAQLMWRGKAEADAGPLEVQAVPIYTAEKIHPKAIIDDIVRRADAVRAPADTPDLFADFNDIDLEDAYTFYNHEVTRRWSNRMILGDSLQVMASLAEKEALRGQVQAIYFDPPYGIKFNSNWQVSTRSRDVKDGKDRTREPEQVRAFRDTWEGGVHSYLNYIRDRMVFMRELLAETGSIFVQIGDENVHRVRSVLDEVFGSENFVSLITIKKSGSATTEHLAGITDYICWYARSIDLLKWRKLYRTDVSRRNDDYGLIEYEPDIWASRAVASAQGLKGRPLQLITLTSQRQGRDTSAGSAMGFGYNFRGREYRPASGRGWTTTAAGMDVLERANRIAVSGNTIRLKKYADDLPGQAVSDFWDDLAAGAGQDKLYVVQTGVSVVERCLLMATDPGDLVLDPTCGSGTTAYVAEQWGRRWITIDTSRVALTLARTRLMGAKYPFYALADSPDGAVEEARLRLGRKLTEGEAAEARSGAFSNDVAHGFVLNRVPHVTLKSMANNKAIDVIWEQWQATLEPARAALNAAAGMAWEEWQIPRAPILPWDDKAGKVHAKVRALLAERATLIADPDTDAKLLARHDKKLGKAIGDLNRLLDRRYSIDDLPEHAGDQLREAALAPHAAWWDARIARQREIDASIAANAETEYLVDKPVLLPNVVRVCGPFTVDSLSPHRVLSADEDDPYLAAMLEDDAPVPHRLGVVPVDDGGDDFVDVVLDNLRVAGVGNTKKGERLRFLDIKPFAGRYVNAEGRYVEGETEGAPERRAAIFIGPEYDTVTRKMIVDAAREAADLFDVLVVAGFAFEAHADQATMQLGRLTVLKVNMNQDLRMARSLKTADQGNLFVVFGEPDVALRRRDDGDYEVEIRGVDIFNPNTGELKPSGKVEDDVACWFIDDDYDGTSFFVRQAYFLGGKDPYEKLKTALKAEIDEDAWSVLNATVSRPFSRAPMGEIGVKVINHYGDEVMKVLPLP